MLRSASEYEYQVIRYTEYGEIALLQSTDYQTPYTLVKDMRPTLGGKYIWNQLNSFSERRIAVREFEEECRYQRRKDEYE